MSDEREFIRFTVALGMAFFQAQSLEHTLVSFFAAIFTIEHEGWEQKVRELMEAQFKQTLGKLLRDAVKELHLSAELTGSATTHPERSVNSRKEI